MQDARDIDVAKLVLDMYTEVVPLYWNYQPVASSGIEYARKLQQAQDNFVQTHRLNIEGIPIMVVWAGFIACYRYNFDPNRFRVDIQYNPKEESLRIVFVMSQLTLGHLTKGINALLQQIDKVKHIKGLI